jgi:hypothetical protein
MSANCPRCGELLQKKEYDKPEQKIKREILEWIEAHSEHGIAWIHTSAGIWDEEKQCYRKNNSRFQINGVADIEGIWAGRPLYIEVKAPGNKLSDDQKEFLALVADYGAISLVAYSLRDVVPELLNFALEDNPE